MKTQIKKLVKSAVFGVTVLGGAMVMQSFGEKEVIVENQQLRYWVNVNGQYEEVPSISPTASCLSGSPEECMLQSTDEDIPSEFSYSEKDDFENLENHPNSSQGVYTP